MTPSVHTATPVTVAHTAEQPAGARVQRRRTAGWRMPTGAVYVGRPTRWGNPFPTAAEFAHYLTDRRQHRYAHLRWPGVTYPTDQDIRRDLAGKTLACWCPPDRACHADVLLDLVAAAGRQGMGRALAAAGRGVVDL